MCPSESGTVTRNIYHADPPTPKTQRDSQIYIVTNSEYTHIVLRPAVRCGKVAGLTCIHRVREVPNFPEIDYPDVPSLRTHTLRKPVLAKEGESRTGPVG